MIWSHECGSKNSTYDSLMICGVRVFCRAAMCQGVGWFCYMMRLVFRKCWLEFPIFSGLTGPYRVGYWLTTHVCEVGFQRQCQQIRQSSSKVDLSPILILWRWGTIFDIVPSRFWFLSSGMCSRVNWPCEIFLEAVGAILLAETLDWMQKPQSPPPSFFVGLKF